ncbi:hypothetical protein ACO0QE_003568 [Hanseniaspora vineae]
MLKGRLQILSKTSLRSYSLKQNEAESQIYQRLSDLHDQNKQDENDPLVKIQKQITAREFEEKYANEIAFAKVSKIANKHAQETILSQPWTGEENVKDTSLRMILDKVGPEKNKNSYFYTNTGFKSKTLKPPKILRAPKISTKERLETAQDKVLNYKLDNQEIEKREASEFRALYAEKFTPIGSLEKIKSLADARIEESMRNDGFAGLEKLRGKKLDISLNNPHVSRTEHHLNNMLVKQNIVPPWIEKQGSVNTEIANFKKSSISSFKRSLHVAFKKMTNTKVDDNLKKKVFAEWKTTNSILIESKIKGLNNSLRTYNLQAPLSTQKFYLLPERELTQIFNGVDVTKEYIAYQQEFSANQKRDSNDDRSFGTSIRSFLKFW